MHKLRAGTDFTVITRRNGDILMRPAKSRRHHATLAENLLALTVLNLEPGRAPPRNLDLEQIAGWLLSLRGRRGPSSDETGPKTASHKSPRLSAWFSPDEAADRILAWQIRIAAS